jgi:RNA polymerase sigma factor (sigma-70 family)
VPFVSEVDSAETLCEPVRSFIQARCKKLLRSNDVTDANVDDLVQEMRIRLIERFENAQKSPDLRVATFLNQLATQTISNDRRYRHAQRRDYRRTVSMNNRVSRGSPMEYAEIFASPKNDGRAVQCKLDVRARMEKLNDSQRRLCFQLAQYSVAEICRMTNQSRPQVEKSVRQLRPYFSDLDME